MGRRYGYCRISTRAQSIERQIRNIAAAYPDAEIVQEVFTGRKVEGRAEFLKLLKKVGSGDTIVFDSVSRMSRNAEDGFQLYQELYAKGVELVFLKEPGINTETYKAAMDKQLRVAVESGDAATDELIKGIAAAVNTYMMRLAERQIHLAFEQAQKEVDDLKQRTSEGMETAKKNGSRVGTEPGRKLNVKKAEPTKKKIEEYSRDFYGKLNDADVMKLVGVSRNTYYKYKKELTEEKKKGNA